MTYFFLTAGALIKEPNNNNHTIDIKNVNLYKSPRWTTCLIKIYNVAFKYINACDLQPGVPYPIELGKYNNRPSLLCNNMIIYQQTKWFEYKLEFTMNENETIHAEDFYTITSVTL